MIDWKNEELLEPPLTKHLSIEELQQIVHEPFNPPKYPCHTQAVERGVKVVTEASAAVSGQSQRDGYIRQKLHSRKNFASYDSKQDFN